MIVDIRGEVLEVGESEFTGKDGQAVRMQWVTLFQGNGGERPGETAQVWTRESLGVRRGEEVTVRARARAEGNRIRLSNAEVLR